MPFVRPGQILRIHSEISTGRKLFGGVLLRGWCNRVVRGGRASDCFWDASGDAVSGRTLLHCGRACADAVSSGDVLCGRQFVACSV
jgi:hypothetical protein